MNIDFDSDSDSTDIVFADIFTADVIPLLGSMVYEALTNGYPVSFAVTRKQSLQISLLSPEGKTKKVYANDVDELHDKAYKIFGLGGNGDNDVKRPTSRSKR